MIRQTPIHTNFSADLSTNSQNIKQAIKGCKMNIHIF